MLFFVKNIWVALLFLALVVGSAFLFFSGVTFQQEIQSRVLAEQRAHVTSLSRAVFSSATTTAAGATDRAAYVNAAERILSGGEGSAAGTASFVRLYDAANGRILVSTAPAEAGTIAAVAPPLKRDAVVSDANVGGRFNTTYLDAGTNLVLWSGADRAFFSGAVIAHLVKQGILIFGFFGIIAGVLVMLQRRFITLPLRRLMRELQEASDGEAKEKRVPRGLGELLEAFKGTTDTIHAALRRDKLISHMKSDFITTTAHQLRTPMSGVHWALDTMLASNSDNLNETQRKLIERALEKTNEMIDIVGTLLNAASIEEGKFGYSLEEASLTEQIQAVMKEEQPTAKEAGTTIAFEEPAESLPPVQVDKERIRWVLRNLIENGIRYTNEGGEVTVSVSRDEDYVQVSVADNGIGIPEEDKEHIFTKFYRGESAIRKRNDGSGLGLYIAKNIISYHGGKIWFDSTEGEGTTFYFTLPVHGSSTDAPEEERPHLNDRGI